ncbi:MAG TPA: hypothetical protein VFI84_04150 [Candidatus Saccharimonadales bacterium]|nr:hypothetical protein [Candidatus Saccharimonadales bacterium]
MSLVKKLMTYKMFVKTTLAFIVSLVATSVSSGYAFAAGPSATCQAHDFFGLKPWYQYLPLDSNCDIKNSFHVLPGGGHQSDLVLILLAVIDDLLRIAGLVAVGFIIYAAISFITSQGNPEDTARARSTAINALVGLVIAIVAVAFVSFLGNKLGG